VRLLTKLIGIFDDREIVSGPLVFLITGNSSTISYLHEAGNENVSLELSPLGNLGNSSFLNISVLHVLSVLFLFLFLF
jgi:hypothetical protein